MAIAGITAAELLLGVELAGARQKRARAEAVEDLLERIPVEDYTLPVARAHARLIAATRRAGRPRSAHDIIIAATAIASDRVLLTHDRTGFDELPDVTVRVI